MPAGWLARHKVGWLAGKTQKPAGWLARHKAGWLAGKNKAGWLAGKTQSRLAGWHHKTPEKAGWHHKIVPLDPQTASLAG